MSFLKCLTYQPKATRRQVMSSITVFDYNGTPIFRRADGYFNLTQMCQANGKRLKDFLNHRRTLSVLSVIYSTQRGQIQHPVQFIDGETWGHFELAAELAYQSKPNFHHWFNSTFYDIEKLFEMKFDVSLFKKWEADNFPWRMDPSNDKEKEGIVYFILNKTRNILKIGFTASADCSQRLSSFKSGAVGESFVVLGEINGTLKTEAMFHSLFSEYRVKGEWFNYNDEVKKYIKTIKFN